MDNQESAVNLSAHQSCRVTRGNYYISGQSSIETSMDSNEDESQTNVVDLAVLMEKRHICCNNNAAEKGNKLSCFRYLKSGTSFVFIKRFLIECLVFCLN